MRMSRLVGIRRHEEESIVTYDYFSLDTRSDDFTYNDKIVINIPVIDPNAKIQTVIRPEYNASFYIFSKYGNVEGGIREGLSLHQYDYAKLHFAALDNQYRPEMIGDPVTLDQWHSVTAQFGSQSVQLTIDGASYTSTRYTEYTDMQGTWYLFLAVFHTNKSKLSIQGTTFYDQSNNVLAHMVPCVKHPGRYIGMQDSVTGLFYPAYFNNQMMTTNNNFLSVSNLT